MRKDILENANTYTLSDFQKLKMAESYKKLYSDTILENANRKKEQYDKRIYNLSIKDLFENFFTVWTQIINEMTTLMYDNDNNRSWNNYLRVLAKNDRIIYVGIMFVFVGLIMYFIFLTR
jgi:hypothetical protein